LVGTANLNGMGTIACIDDARDRVLDSLAEAGLVVLVGESDTHRETAFVQYYHQRVAPASTAHPGYTLLSAPAGGCHFMTGSIRVSSMT
jgi:hypothetical protein